MAAERTCTDGLRTAAAELEQEEDRCRSFEDDEMLLVIAGIQYRACTAAFEPLGKARTGCDEVTAQLKQCTLCSRQVGLRPRTLLAQSTLERGCTLVVQRRRTAAAGDPVGLGNEVRKEIRAVQIT